MNSNKEANFFMKSCKCIVLKMKNAGQKKKVSFRLCVRQEWKIIIYLMILQKKKIEIGNKGNDERNIFDKWMDTRIRGRVFDKPQANFLQQVPR